MTEILIVGVGGAGGYLAQYMEATFGYPVLAVNTDNDSPKRSGFSRRLFIGSKTSRKHGKGARHRGHCGGHLADGD